MTTRRAAKLKSIATRSTDLAFATPQVVARRLARLAAAGPVPSPRDRKEFELMASEKAAAFTESWRAMARQALRPNVALATSLARSFWSPWPGSRASTRVRNQMHDAVLDVLDKGLAPIQRKANANAKRLAGTKAGLRKRR